MGEEPTQIKGHIAVALRDLHGNVRALEDRLEQALDWRTYFRRHPVLFLGIAWGGGFLLSRLLGRSRRPLGPAAHGKGAPFR